MRPVEQALAAGCSEATTEGKKGWTSVQPGTVSVAQAFPDRPRIE